MRPRFSLQLSPFAGKAILLGGLVCVLGAWMVWAMLWYSPPLRARLVTPQGAPVAGAIVVANWTITEAVSGAPLGQAMLIEIVSDNDGQFELPAWGPRSIKRGSIQLDQPTLRVFKAGFVPLVLTNLVGTSSALPNHILVSRFDGKTIRLTPFAGTPEEYEIALQPLLQSIEVFFWGRGAIDCYWKSMPRLLLALQEAKSAMAIHGSGQSLRDAHQYAGENSRAQCGDAQQFFREYK